ncbi:MAG: leucyl aminopeptidase [Myxococcota bacterium]|jgi:leucyl aminopeptidase
MNIQLSSATSADANVDLLAIGVAESADLASALSALGDLGASLAAAAGADDFTGAAAASVVYPTFGQIGASRVALVGLGGGSDDELRRAGRAIGRAARSKGIDHVGLSFGALSAGQTQAVVEGFGAGNYKFDKYKAEGDRKSAAGSLSLLGGASAAGFAAASAIIAGQSLARDLVNEPAAEIYPETLAAVASSLSDDRITVTVWDEEKILAERMGGIIGVGQGSSRPPRFIHIHYRPTATPSRTIALVGKGVTFDSGGLSLKPSGSMMTMRCDMGGSAVVIGVIKAIAALQPDVEVHGIIGAVENMCAANSFKLGDILKMRNGKTVEVHNTDAEGRLVLADCLAYASELKPDAILDFATLTGAVVVALGEYYTGLFTKDNALAGQLLSSADDAGEGLWRLPLPDFYKEKLKAEWGDIKNVGGRSAGATTAALFLSEFVEEGISWAHCDVAGPTFLDKPFRDYVAGGTGAMVSTITRWLND